MTVGHGSSPDSTETAIDSMEAPPAGRGSVRVSGPAAIGRWTRRCLARWRSIVATVLVVAAVGAAVGLFFILYRPDRQIDDTTAHRAIQAASDGAVDVLSYSYTALDRDFAKAKSHLTGNFLAYYSKFTEQFVAPVGAEGSTDDDRQGDSGRRVGVASQFGCRAGVCRPDHGKHAEARTRQGRQQRPGHADEDQRFLADRELRPGRMSAEDLCFERITWSAEAVLTHRTKAEIGLNNVGICASRST